jgi:hypothetical protein
VLNAATVALGVIAVIRTSCSKKYVEPLNMKIRTTFAVEVPAATMSISSIRLPLDPAVKSVPTLVGAVLEVSAVEIDTDEQRGVAAKFGAVAIYYFSPFSGIGRIVSKARQSLLCLLRQLRLYFQLRLDLPCHLFEQR